MTTRSLLLCFAPSLWVLLAVNAAPGQAPNDPPRGNDVCTWTARLKSPDAQVRRTAAGALAGVGDCSLGPAVPVLIEALQDPDAEVRCLAVRALRQSGAPPRLYRSAFLAAGRDPAIEVRREVIDALRRFYQREPLVYWPWSHVGPVLEAATRDSDVKIRCEVALVLSGYGEDAVPSLTRLLVDSDAEVREHAGAALHNIGPAAKRAVPALIAAVRHDDPRLLQRTLSLHLAPLARRQGPRRRSCSVCFTTRTRIRRSPPP
jgi:HEAT repeat protein